MPHDNHAAGDRPCDDRDREYLNTILRMQPTSQADEMLQLRGRFLASRELGDGEVLAVEVAQQDSRPQMLQSLAELRRQFWTLPAFQMHQQLNRLAAAPYPDVAAVAARLLAVSAQRESFHRLACEQTVHPAFVEALRKITVATPAQANPLREQQLGFIRPDRNPQYQHAQHAIQTAIRLLIERYPEIYALEQTWLNELYNYNPEWDIVRADETNEFDTLAGLIILAVIPLCAYVAWAILFQD